MFPSDLQTFAASTSTHRAISQAHLLHTLYCGVENVDNNFSFSEWLSLQWTASNTKDCAYKGKVVWAPSFKEFYKEKNVK